MKADAAQIALIGRSLTASHDLSFDSLVFLMRFLTASLFLFVSFATAAMGGEDDAQQLFARFKTLEGEWKIAEPARTTSVSFEVIANGSALVEKWIMSPTRTSMTVYSMDGDRLLVTHYCPQGNAPRLVYERTREDGMYYFEFLDGQNLQDAEGSHQHTFWIRFDSENSFTRSETYIKNGALSEPVSQIDRPQVFVRVEKNDKASVSSSVN